MKNYPKYLSVTLPIYLSFAVACGDDGGGSDSPDASAESSCSDEIQNQDESDVDCGGSCDPCAIGQSCEESSDCASGNCNDDDTCADAVYAVGGNVSGLIGTGLVLQNNSEDDLSIEADGSFAFTTGLADEASYEVSVLSQPDGQICTVESGTGTIAAADVEDIAVSCINHNQLFAGGRHNCVILADNSVKCWGVGGLGQLGSEDNANLGDGPDEMGSDLSAINLGTGRSAKSLSTGANHSCALLDNDTLKCWGLNFQGQLGFGSQSNRGAAKGHMGDNLQPIDLGTARTPEFVALGHNHSCAILDNGDLKCWGRNSSGALGIGDPTNRGNAPGEMGDALPRVELGSDRTATFVAGGDLHTCAILDDGSVKCWGNNTSGQLGILSNAVGDGPDEMGDNLLPIDLGTGRTAVTVSLGVKTSCALLDDGSVKCWGNNEFGQLGRGDTTNLNSVGDAVEAIDLGTGRTAVDISAGFFHACALLDNGSVKCWGQNAFGQLGQGGTADLGDEAGEMGDALPAVNLGTGRTALQVKAGDTHTCALLDDNSVKCWGRNNVGQLGLGDALSRGVAPGEMGDDLPLVEVE